MRKLNTTLERPVDLGYVTYHEAQEAHHSQATLDELFENFHSGWPAPLATVFGLQIGVVENET